MRPKPKTIPTIFGIIVLVIGVGMGVVATQYEAIFRLGAQSEANPQDVRISNISDTSAVVSWVTDVASTAVLQWGDNQILSRTTPEQSTTPGNTHYVTLSELNPDTPYSFKISAGGREFSNNGASWQFQTAPSASPPTDPVVISGTILNAQGQPTPGVLVYITAEGVSPTVARTSESGNWLIPLGLSRSSLNVSTFAAVNPNLTLQIFVQGGPLGVSTATALAGNADPVPAITLGQTHDFTNVENSGSSELPEASIDVGETATDSANRFDFLEDEVPTESSPSNAITLESIDNGEIITTSTPEFFGEGPAGTVFTITVESDPITDNVSIPPSGVWQWSPPTNLPPGEHKVTIKWNDINGILRTFTRSFVVSAQEGPAFVSTPSGSTPSPSARPTATPTLRPSATPRVTASPVATATATATPRVSYPSTDSGTPNAGSLTPTLALSMMGVGLFIAAFFISKKYA